MEKQERAASGNVFQFSSAACANYLSIKSIKICFFTGLHAEQIVEDRAHEVVVEERARLGVAHQKRQDGEPGELQVDSVL